ncbi:MAG TPA: ParB N-terminal domain-containing protein [Anaeromyxobacteraceae bacterium]|nr:ParB N-terminal domain-containing protein [Anaeromyxobacteraceae bacterium]
MELVPRTTAPHHATGSVELVPLAAISPDATFRLREPGDVSPLAGSIARLGQLGPVELRPLPGAGDGPVRFQLVAGFRRVAAVRLLARGRVLARVHQRLDDEDAWALALSQALLGEPLAAAELEALRARLREARLAPWAEELVDEALVRAPVDPAERERFLQFLAGAPAEAEAAPSDEDAASAAAAEEPEAGAAEPPTEELTAEELAAELATRLWEVNQDLSTAVDAWDELPEEARRMILDQARYMAELYPYLAKGRR